MSKSRKMTHEEKDTFRKGVNSAVSYVKGWPAWKKEAYGIASHEIRNSNAVQHASKDRSGGSMILTKYEAKAVLLCAHCNGVIEGVQIADDDYLHSCSDCQVVEGPVFYADAEAWENELILKVEV